MSSTTLLQRLIAVLALAALLTPFTHAQDPYDCFPDLDTHLFGPDPEPDPYPDGARQAPEAEDDATTRYARGLAVFRARLSRPGGLTASRGGATACASDEQWQPWDSGAWGPTDYRIEATYDAAERMLSITEFYYEGSEVANYERRSFTYDGAGRWTGSLLEDTFEGTTLQPKDRVTYTYGDDGRLTDALQETATDTGWAPEVRALVGYGSGPYATSILNQRWSGSTWANDFRQTYAYSGSDQRTMILFEEWQDSAWVNDSRERLAYDGSGRLESYTYDDREGPSGWAPFTRRAYTYDADGRLTDRRSQFWSGNTWQDNYVQDFTYTADTLLSEATGSDANGDGTYTPNFRQRFAYAGGELAERVFDTWTGADWMVDDRTVYVRDAQARPTEIVNQYWTGAAFQNFRRLLLSYDGSTSAEDDPAAQALALTVGPNPAGARATARFALSEAGPVRVVVTDALGRQVLALERTLAAGAQAMPVDTGRLAPGLYVVRLHVGTLAVTRRLVVVR